MYLIDQRLVSLLKVAETGSFTKASEVLNITQPAVSQQIRTLEEELDVKIFDRSHNELHLTRSGEIVVKYARRMMSFGENLIQTLRDENSKVTSVSVGLTHTVESSAIVETIASYAKDHQGLSIKIITDSIDNLQRMLKNSEIDFIIMGGILKGKELIIQPLDVDKLVVAMSPEHPFATKDVITIDELKQERMILRLPSSNTRRLFIEALNDINLSIDDFNIILEIDNIATIKDLIRRGFGVSVLAESACEDELKKKKITVRPIEKLNLEREINIVYTKDFEHPEIVSDIIKKYRNSY